MPDTLPPAAYAPSTRSRVRRHHERAHYDRDTVFAILDAALICHIGYVIDSQPYVTPTLFWRDGERLYWHGSSASRMLRTQAAGIAVCLTVAHVDGLVVARSAFRHSLNYRAVMAFGTAAIVTDPAEKEAGFNALIERLYPGRTGIMRGITPEELKATALLGMTIDDASAKVRAGGPLDLEADYAAECWAGTIPVAQHLGAAIPDPLAPPRGAPEPEVGHFAEGARFDDILHTRLPAGRPVMDKAPPPLSLAAARALTPPEGSRAAEVLRDGDLWVRFAAQPTSGPQVPHTRDEFYVVASGTARYRWDGGETTVGPGDLLFAAARTEHGYDRFSEDFSVWVVFYGPER